MKSTHQLGYAFHIFGSALCVYGFVLAFKGNWFSAFFIGIVQSAIFFILGKALMEEDEEEIETTGVNPHCMGSAPSSRLSATEHQQAKDMSERAVKREEELGLRPSSFTKPEK